MTLQAPAKVNLTLAVLGRRADGFHEIESWVVKFAWYDRLTFSPARELSLTVSGEATGVAADDSNLVLRAARALAAESGHPPSAAIALEKHIPVGAGIGGGSSDAAVTLKALNELWGLHWDNDRLKSVAERIGSDVPLFLDEASAVVIRGRGELIEPLATSPRGWLAIIVPNYSIATAAVYCEADSYLHPPSNAKQPWIGLPRSAAQLQLELFNDLQAAATAIEPRLATLHAGLNGLNGRRVHMTGSGSCFFALFDAPEEAQAWRHIALARANQPIRIEVVSML